MFHTTLDKSSSLVEQQIEIAFFWMGRGRLDLDSAPGVQVQRKPAPASRLTRSMTALLDRVFGAKTPKYWFRLTCSASFPHKGKRDFVEGRGKGVCLKSRHTAAQMIGALKPLGGNAGWM
jgi:hypothetical protein